MQRRFQKATGDSRTAPGAYCQIRSAALLNFHLLVSPGQIQFGEWFTICKCWKDFIGGWQWEGLHPQVCVLLFWSQHISLCPRPSSWLPLLELPSHSGPQTLATRLPLVSVWLLPLDLVVQRGMAQYLQNLASAPSYSSTSALIPLSRPSSSFVTSGNSFIHVAECNVCTWGSSSPHWASFGPIR